MAQSLKLVQFGHVYNQLKNEAEKQSSLSHAAATASLRVHCGKHSMSKMPLWNHSKKK